MCGIAGYYCIEEFDPRLNMALLVLGTHMERRGNQGWGFTNGERIWKTMGALTDSIDPSVYDNKTALLHTRWATFGDKVQKNNHPFDIGGLLGVHNGQIYNHREMANKYGFEYEVDSEILFHFLANGMDTGELTGYGATVFFDDVGIKIGRWNSGDMELAKTDWGWIWASTKTAVESALRISGLGPARFWPKLKEGNLYGLNGHTLFTDPRKISMKRYTSYTTTRRWDYATQSWIEEGPQKNAAGIVVSSTPHSGITITPGMTAKEIDEMADRYLAEGKKLQDSVKQPKWWERTDPDGWDDRLPAAYRFGVAPVKLDNEPSSDDDDVVEIGTDCHYCGEELIGEFQTTRFGPACMLCVKDGYVEYDEIIDADVPDDPETFQVYMAEELWNHSGISNNLSLWIPCAECGAEHRGDDEVYFNGKTVLCFACWDLLARELGSEPEPMATQQSEVIATA